MTPHTILARNPDLACSELDGTLVILNLETAGYFGLNETGKFIWEQIDGRHTVAQVCESLMEEYAVDDQPSVQEDTMSLIFSLVEKDLLRVVSPNDGGSV